MVEFARRNRLPFTWLDLEHEGEADAKDLFDGMAESQLPLVRLPGGPDLRNPTPGQVPGRWASASSSSRARRSTCSSSAPALRAWAAVYGASEGPDTLVVVESTALAGQAGTSWRIENYLGFPAGISGSELTTRAITQARKFAARTATPYRALAPNRVRGARRAPGRRPLCCCLRGPAGHRRAVPALAGGGHWRTTLCVRTLCVGSLRRWAGMSPG